MRLWDFWDDLCIVGYGVQARWEALSQHLLKGHSVAWVEDPEPWLGCFGSIRCKNCDLILWHRHSRWSFHASQWLCGLLGHPGREHWLDGSTGLETDGWYCVRCCKDLG